MAQIFLGTQGWTNRSWIGGFYPAGTSREDMLGYYAQAFPTVEVRRSFYEMPTDPEIRDWYSVVPTDFKFALRVPQQISHEMRLTGTERLLSKFLQRVDGLGEKLGPVLIQLPTGFTPDAEARAAFFAFVDALPDGFGWAVEFRDKSWLAEDVFANLRNKGVAFVLSDGRWVKRDVVQQIATEITAGWVYVRWNASSGFPMSDFSRVREEKSEILSQWATVLWPLSERVNHIFGYFDDRFEGHAPHSARVFQRKMGLAPVEPENLCLENHVQNADN